jgi:hypothetical protein
VTTDPALRVLADGVLVEPQWDTPWLAIALPDETRTLNLVSRAAAPAFLAPASEDWRTLGVRVHAVRLDGDDLALDDPRLASGWHAAEGAWRWTDGVGLIRVDGASVVELAIAPSGLAFAFAASGTSSRAPPISPARAS